MNKYDENYFNNITANGVISGDEIRLFIGRILQHGYRGTISTSWRSQNESAANSIAHAYATQLLIWETVVGERDANFNHKAASGCSNVKDVINAKHPLRSKIMNYYNSMVSSVQNHTVVPSFCTKSKHSVELTYAGQDVAVTETATSFVNERQKVKIAIELFTHGSLNTFAKQTNVDTNNRLICYDILDLGKQLMPIGMLVVLDSILNRITQNRAKGKNTFIFIDEIYLLFQHEYSANFLFTLWKRVRKYGAFLSM